MNDFESIKTAAIGKWPGILSSLGIEVGTGKHTACPVCSPGEEDSDRFRFDDTGRGTWICSVCGAGDGFALVQKVLGCDIKEAFETVEGLVGTVETTPHQPEKPPSPENLREMYKQSKPVEKGDAVHAYLKKRGLQSMPASLRCTAFAWEPETKQNQRAMLATFQLPDGEAVTIHRTFLDNEGNKLDIKSPKKMMPTLKKMTGGAVRLYPWDPGYDGKDTLCVCEGIETAVALREEYELPIWPCLSATLLEGFEPPAGVEKMIIFADNDKNFTGQKAAFLLAHRLAMKNKIISEVEVPHVQGDDWLDQILDWRRTGDNIHRPRNN